MQKSGIFQSVDTEEVDSKLKEASNLHQALVWVNKGKSGSIQWVDNCTEEQFNLYCLSKKTKTLGTIAKYGLLLCTILDMPSWCRGTPEECSSYVSQMYSPGFTVLPVRAGAGISLVFWIILAGRMNLRRLAMGDAYSFHQWHFFTAVVLFIGVSSALLSLAVPMVYNLSVMCRPFAFLGCTKTLRKGVAEIIRSIPGFIDVLVSLAICVFVGVWMGMVLFARTPEGTAFFFAWRQAFAQMWILFTTNNTPNVIMPAYNDNRCYFWFFFVYLLVTVFLLGNVLLAKVYDTYKDVLRNEHYVFIENQRVAVCRAFALLADSQTGIITSQTWREFFMLYCDPSLGSIQVGDPNDSDHTMEQANFILHTCHDVNVEQSGINAEQFKKISDVLFDDAIYIARKSPPKTQFHYECLEHLNNFFLHGANIGGHHITWDGCMDGVISLGTALVFVESWLFAHTYNTRGVFMNIFNPIFWILFVFSLIYVFAISTKIGNLGWERFWYRNSTQHRFDFFNVYGLLAAELLAIFVFPNVAMMRTVMLLHMCRGMRLFYYIDPLQNFFLLMTRLVPIYWKMGMILFIVYWVFCDIGQLWFGGLIYTSNPNLQGTDFASPGFDFYELNFNCFLDGMITLFTLMCMNNWSDTSDGYMQVTQSYMSQAYFVAFTLICNMIVLNILIALILDCTGVLSAEIEEAQNAGSQQEGGGGQGGQQSVLRKVLGADEEYFSDSSSSAFSTSSDDEDKKAMGPTPSLREDPQSSIRHKKKKQSQGAKASTSLSADLTKEERKRFDRLLGTPTSKSGAAKRKSIG